MPISEEKKIIFEWRSYKDGLIRYVIVANKLIEFMNKDNLEGIDLLREKLKNENIVEIDLDKLAKTREDRPFLRFKFYLKDLSKNNGLISFHCWECNKDYKGNKLKSKPYTEPRKVFVPGCVWSGINFFCPKGHCVESVTTAKSYVVPKRWRRRLAEHIS